MEVADVLVAGAGPAGWAFAHACAGAGLRTALVAPQPRRRWHQTFGLWADECDNVVALTVSTAVAFGNQAHRLDRRYAILDNAATLERFTSAPVTVVDDRMMRWHTGEHGSTVELASGRLLAAAVVADATGCARRHGLAEQTAVGGYVEPSAAEALVAPGEALFMDWRGGGGTFLYAVPLGDRVLLEETSLAGRPGMPLAVLRGALRERLRRHGIDLDPALGEERVRFPLDPPVPGVTGAVTFGAAAALMHPATGYSVGTSFALAPVVAEAIADALPRGPRAAVRAVRHVLWPPSAKAVHVLRRMGLRALLRMPPADLPEFFDTFFTLPGELQRAYLSGRTDVAGTTAAMAALFRTSSWGMRRRLVG